MSGLVDPASDLIAVRRRASGPQAQCGAAVIVITHALGCGFTLQLRKHHDDVQHGAAHGGFGVEVLADRHKFHAVGLQDFPQLAEVCHTAGKTVQTVDIQRADAVGFDVPEQLLKGRPLGVLAGIAAVPVDLQSLDPRCAAAEVDLPRKGQAVLFLHRLTGIDHILSHVMPSPFPSFSPCCALSAPRQGRPPRQPAAAPCAAPVFHTVDGCV